MEERTDREVETNKLFEAEWNLMDIVWGERRSPQSRVSAIAGQRFWLGEKYHPHRAQAAYCKGRDPARGKWILP